MSLVQLCSYKNVHYSHSFPVVILHACMACSFYSTKHTVTLILYTLQAHILLKIAIVHQQYNGFQKSATSKQSIIIILQIYPTHIYVVKVARLRSVYKSSNIYTSSKYRHLEVVEVRSLNGIIINREAMFYFTTSGMPINKGSIIMHSLVCK